MKPFMTITFIFLVITSQAQITRQHNAPRSGDQIIKQHVDYKDPGRAGKNVIWDFGQLSPVNPEYSLSYYEIPLINDSIYVYGRDTIPVGEILPGELFVGTEYYSSYYYRIKNDSLFVVGHENPMVLVRHTSPLSVVNYPFNYGDSIQTVYNSEGVYSMRQTIKSQGEIFIKCDAYGKIILPSKDTLDNVLRIKSVQTIIDADSSNYEEEYPFKLETETYRWFVKGYRYPIFETVRTFEVSDTSHNEVLSSAFFFPPQEHLYLETDDVNLAVLDSLWNIPVGGNGQGSNPGGGGNNGNLPIPELHLVYNYYPNPVKDMLYVEYSFDAKATVSIILYDMNGIAVRTLPARELNRGLYRDTINCQGLPAGNYLLYLIVGDEIGNGMILKK